MEQKELFSMITLKAMEAMKQQEEILQKLEVNKDDKTRAEKDKREALEAKDEAAYKKACRDLADAEAGIEFNTICLEKSKRKPNATEKETEEILRSLKNTAYEIYLSTMLKIEKAMMEVVEAAEPAVKEFNRIDEMVRTWRRTIMNEHDERILNINITREYKITISKFITEVQPHLFGFKTMHDKNPFLKEGGRNNAD